MRTLTVLGACAVLCVSCSSGHVKIPGEEVVLKENECKAFYTQGLEAERKEEYGKAAELFGKALESDQLFFSAYYKQGRCYALMGNWAEAEFIFRELLETDSENSSLQQSLAFVLLQGEKDSIPEALTILEDLYRKNPYDISLCSLRIKAFVVADELERAEESYAVFAETFPSELEKIRELDAVVHPNSLNDDSED